MEVGSSYVLSTSITLKSFQQLLQIFSEFSLYTHQTLSSSLGSSPHPDFQEDSLHPSACPAPNFSFWLPFLKSFGLTYDHTYPQLIIPPFAFPFNLPGSQLYCNTSSEKNINYSFSEKVSVWCNGELKDASRSYPKVQNCLKFPKS